MDSLKFSFHFFPVIVLIVPEDDLRAYMIRAHALGMDGGDYQFLFIKTTLLTVDEISELQSTVLWEKGDSNDEAARKGFENLLYVSNRKVKTFNHHD